MHSSPRPVRRLLWMGTLAAAVVATALHLPAESDRNGGLAGLYNAARAANGLPHDEKAGQPHLDMYDDPATKNAVSRAGDVSEETQDPTTPAEGAANEAYVAADRRSPEPALGRAPIAPPRPSDPTTRFAMANGCYALTTGGAWVQRTDDGLAATSRRSEAEPFYFKPTDLGTYLLYGKTRDFLAGGDRVTMAADPGADTEWTVARAGTRFTLRLGMDHYLAVGDGRTLVVGTKAARFDIAGVPGCTSYPESQIGMKGAPFSGTTDMQEVRGYVDAHTHGMAFEFLGGEVHCGRPWSRYGAADALVDCDDHSATGGNGAALEALLSGEPSHDPVGWPTFKDWPAPNSLTHEGTYYRWLERSWRGGQRIFVNLLVENNQLCELYPLKRNSCDDMDSVRLQAKDMYKMQDYIDAQFGGPGRGFYRIVRTPWQARRVINAGKMAVVMGMETSVPFGCTFKATPGMGDVPECDPASIDAQLDEVRALGVRQMELVNKFDNALSGVAGDSGEVGMAVNSANFRETNSYWDMRTCDPADTPNHDKNQLAAPEINGEQQDALFGAVGQLFGTGIPALPLYPPPNHCNERGLTTLGEKVIDGLTRRGMLFDPDHMSVKARNSALDQVEESGYSGVVSSHSWSTEDAYPRIYELGGFIAPYAGDSTGFVEKWRKHLEWADKRYYFGFGYGADMNGLGAQGDPRGADVPDPVTYPFTGLGGVTVKKQHAGERVYDINVDGVAQYGLYPDWIEDLRIIANTQQGDGADIVKDMARGAEAYLQTWERAVGIAPDSCRNPGLRKGVRKVQDLVRDGMTTRQVMKAVGQPFRRLGNRFTVCATAAGDPEVEMVVTFSKTGRVTGLTRKA